MQALDPAILTASYSSWLTFSIAFGPPLCCLPLFAFLVSWTGSARALLLQASGSQREASVAQDPACTSRPSPSRPLPDGILRETPSHLWGVEASAEGKEMLCTTMHCVLSRRHPQVFGKQRRVAGAGAGAVQEGLLTARAERSKAEQSGAERSSNRKGKAHIDRGVPPLPCVRLALR